MTLYNPRWYYDAIERYVLDGGTESWSVSVLQALVRLTRPLNLLELGTFHGHTSRALAGVMPENARLWTVDHERHHEGFEDARIVFWKSDAIAFLETERIPFDFAFVDDDHTKEHVEREIELLKLRMSPGGLIVLHDVIGPFGLDEIVLKEGGFVIELPLLHVAGGLGIIRA
jgi:predicted O-methyltransferase YrrM